MIKSLHSATVHSRNVSCTEDGWFTLCMKNAFRGCVFVCVCAHAPDLRLCVRFLSQKLFFFVFFVFFLVCFDFFLEFSNVVLSVQFMSSVLISDVGNKGCCYQPSVALHSGLLASFVG
jgi:hypothetical protein